VVGSPSLPKASASLFVALARWNEYVVEFIPRGSKMFSWTYCASEGLEGWRTVGRYERTAYIRLLYCTHN
jgi:hypothetical protein